MRPQRVSADLLKLMARAGLRHIEYGSDSFCDDVLTAYGKHLTFAEIREATETARNAGVDCCHFLVCGGPGETEATLQATFENSRQLGDTPIMARAGMRVYPGTPLFEALARERRTPAAENLLEPFYYLAPPLTADGVLAQLRGFSRAEPNWIVDDPPPTYVRMVERLRAKGVVGPLWSYFAMLQRLGAALAPPPAQRT
jgi:coproporphyrinogen III oxidase-like Fe-S oxidoreductase